ncbi:MAG: cation:proton antiporter [Candidatus Omnitrophica bacterium]|nr:cation:proton antiporter [Candidatus Omnitrophota bacterium]MDD5352054.1 cation:proton antiporter [Candidatus Omnitrophota bacterium]MDD5549652.1 cation:proton antiporter [Candidatus Omnitrophota bacterium]
MNTILGLGFILLIGLFSARLINKIKFPAVTAYLLSGILIGPSVFKLIPNDVISASGLISNIVLGIIAFGIGQNFSRDNFRKIGRSVIWISVLEACGAWIFVTLVFLIILRQPFYLSLLFGALSSATAPAATVMVIREYRAKGNFTDTLLGVVAIDDAWCLIIFAISLAISQAIYAHMLATFFLIKVFLNSILSIFGAFILGGIVATLLAYLSRYLRTQTELLIFTLGFVFLNIGIAIWLNLSVLLANMFLGATLVNINKSSFNFFDSIKTLDPPLFLLFFVLAGANLEISILGKLGLIGLVYLIFRVMGKMIGAGIGARISGASRSIKRYLGLGLVPQAGVALGCALIAKNDFPNVGSMIFTTIIATTVIYELIGPLCTKYALQKAGEILIEPPKNI